MSFHVPARYRITDPNIAGNYYSDTTFGNNGLFFIQAGASKLRVIASDGDGWEHVSVSLINRCPSWEEMCKIKSLFWDDEDAVMQIHPRKSEYVTYHAFCLHLWRPNDGREIPLPHYATVGPKKGQTVEQSLREYDKVAK